MAKTKLNPKLLTKLARKTDKSEQYVREQISRRATRLGISSLAAQIVWAKELGFGITHALNKLPAEVREEIRSAQIAVGPNRQSANIAAKPSRTVRKKSGRISAATINSLLQDEQLRERCKDLLLARKHFDRVLREATTVLDDRLKTRSGIGNMNPVSLVGKVLNPDPQKAVFQVSAERDEQEGFHGICKGIMLAFRNKTHHSLTDKFTREDALKFCGFIDTLLGTIQQAEVHAERI